MDAIPGILSGAQSLLNGGFSSLNRAAAEFTSGNSNPSDPRINSAIRDPFLGGMLDLYSARENVSAGVALLHYADRYDPTNPYAAEHVFDRYA